MDKTHRDLVALAGLQSRGGRCRPRLHDLRHSFAVKTIIDWHRDGLDVDARMPLLSKVLGHADPKATFWYMQAAPELLALADVDGALVGGASLDAPAFAEIVAAAASVSRTVR